MKLLRIKIFFGSALSLVMLSSFFQNEVLLKLSAAVVIKQVQQGKSITIKGDVYYQQNGKLTTHFVSPKEYVMLSNNFGEVKVYDPEKNTVLQYQNFLFSSQTSQFYYFFTGKAYDMGLSSIGYAQDKTYNQDQLLVTEWRLKVPDKKTAIQKVKLVYENRKPVYMDYRTAEDKIIRKVFYYNYTHLFSYDFPSTTTEIVYADKDSTVSKTSYSDIKTNDQANSTYFNFTIPSNAKSE